MIKFVYGCKYMAKLHVKTQHYNRINNRSGPNSDCVIFIMGSLAYRYLKKREDFPYFFALYIFMEII